jgi:predicted regulator of Ras-like GTPase activity (Roadblock/LC7/MglB family)
MAPSTGQPKDPGDGFEGAIRGLSLPAVIQFNAQNQFTGCLAIHSGDSTGLVFFLAGGVVHVEHGDRIGEEAFYDIMEWPNGRFKLHPGLTSTRSTIQKSSQHLLLDASRVLDERRAGRMPQTTPPVPREPGVKALKASDIIEKVQAVPGVLYAVLQTKDGSRVGDQSFEAEVLAGQGSFLAMVGSQLAPIFQTGELVSATVEGKTRHLLLIGMKNHYLCVLVSGDSKAGAVEAHIRQTLSWNR